MKITKITNTARKNRAAKRAKRKSKNTEVRNKELLFYRDGKGWYADVMGHTQAQNAMVAGADALIEGFSGGKPGVIIRVSSDCPDPDPYTIRLKRILHDPFGGTYLAFLPGKRLPRPAWICNVTHTVFGEHPKQIFIHDVRPVDDPQPKTKGIREKVEVTL